MTVNITSEEGSVVAELALANLNITLDEDARQSLSLNITQEGVIFDAYLDGEHVGTIGMTYQEWWDHVEGK